MDQKGPSKVVLKKKKTDVSLLKLTKSDTGIPRIPKTFVFDQNLPKEEYLKYINPENIIPESLEVATKVFSSYRKRIGGSGIEALNQDLPQILKPKSSLPFFDHNKSSAREIASYRENVPSYEGSVMHDTKLHVSMKKTMDKSRHDEIIQDNTLDLKGMLKDIASFSASQEHRNEGYTDGQQTSPNRAKGSLRNGDDSINLSKIKRGAQEKEKEDLAGAGQNSGKENIKKNYHQHKRSEGDIIHMMAKKKKKKVTADQYEITDLDNTQEIVRKTDVAVKTLSKRSEQVKREMKNFEENVKAKLKESESAPISSLRAVNLVRDYVFNEEEFAKLIEEEEREEEREKAQKEYNQRNQLKKKKVNLKPTESKVKGFSNTMTARFTHIPFPKASPRNDAITITKEEKKKVEQVVEQHVAIKEEELKKQVEVQMRIHEKYGVFSNENNLFRINSMNYTKLMKEKEKIRDHLLQELKHTKYKERERESKMFTAQSHRVRSIHSDRPSRQDLDYGREDDKGKDVIKKEDAKTQYINKIKEVLTKPVKDNIGSKPSELSTHVNRLYGLRKKYTTTDIERVNQASYHNL